LFGLDDDAQGEREELAFRCWANNLGIEDFFINNLFDACADGLSLLKIIDAVEPGLVNWKKVQKKPKMVFHKNSNHTYALSLLKGIGSDKNTDIGIKFSLVGIGGKNITDGDKKYVLSCIWQLYRYHSVKFLAQLRANSGEKLTDQLILQWANTMVEGVGGSPMKSFSDPAGADGIWACNLVKSIDPEVFDDEFVSTENTPESNRLNTRYAISVARRHGCMVFMLPDDILECNKKLVLTFAAAVIKKARGL
jgi:plastin-1